MKNNEFLWKYVCRCNPLDSPNCFVWSTMPQRICSEYYCFSKYGCIVNHAMEDLEHRMLDFSKYCLLRYHVKVEGKRGKIQMAKGKIQSVKRDKQKSNSDQGWQDGGNVTDINCRIKIYIKCKLWFYNFIPTIIVVMSYVEAFRIDLWSIHAYKVFRWHPLNNRL